MADQIEQAERLLDKAEKLLDKEADLDGFEKGVEYIAQAQNDVTEAEELLLKLQVRTAELEIKIHEHFEGV